MCATARTRTTRARHSGGACRGAAAALGEAAARTPAELPPGRTLLVVNVPSDATVSALALLFKPAGTVERVVFPPADRDAGGADPLLDDGPDSDVEMVEKEDAGVEPLPRKRKRGAGEAQARPPPAVPLPETNVCTLRRSG
jgi:ribosomal RNA-processing protein 7